jgi:hypothetical protein
MEEYEYIEKLSDEELIKIVNALGDYSEVSFALSELMNRKNPIYLVHASRIYNNKLGDIFFQTSAFRKIYSGDRDRALELLENDLESIPAYILSSAAECLCIDSVEIIEKNLYRDLLKKILLKFETVDTEGDQYIIENFKWFKETF